MRRAPLLLLLLLWIPTLIVGVAGAHAGAVASVDIVAARVAGPRGPEPAQAAYTDPVDASALTFGDGPPPLPGSSVRAEPQRGACAAPASTCRADQRRRLDAALGHARARNGFLTVTTSLAPPTALA